VNFTVNKDNSSRAILLILYRGDVLKFCLLIRSRYSSHGCDRSCISEACSCSQLDTMYLCLLLASAAHMYHVSQYSLPSKQSASSTQKSNWVGMMLILLDPYSLYLQKQIHLLNLFKNCLGKFKDNCKDLIFPSLQNECICGAINRLDTVMIDFNDFAIPLFDLEAFLFVLPYCCN
jgi:hypothetical protein